MAVVAPSTTLYPGGSFPGTIPSAGDLFPGPSIYPGENIYPGAAPVNFFFAPPTVLEAWPMNDREPTLMKRVRVPRGISVIVENGIWTEGRNFDQDRINAAQKYYQGGYKHGPLTSQEVNDLIAHGYENNLVTESV